MENITTKSRWKLNCKTLPCIQQYVTEVSCDYYTKSVSATVLDVVLNNKPIVHDWIIKTLRNPNDEVLTLLHHDGNGNVLYKKILTGVKLVGHTCNHNYDCEGDDLQDHELLFTYENLETETNE